MKVLSLKSYLKVRFKIDSGFKKPRKSTLIKETKKIEKEQVIQVKSKIAYPISAIMMIIVILFAGCIGARNDLPNIIYAAPEKPLLFSERHVDVDQDCTTNRVTWYLDNTEYATTKVTGSTSILGCDGGTVMKPNISNISSGYHNFTLKNSNNNVSLGKVYQIYIFNTTIVLKDGNATVTVLLPNRGTWDELFNSIETVNWYLDDNYLGNTEGDYISSYTMWGFSRGDRAAIFEINKSNIPKGKHILTASDTNGKIYGTRTVIRQ